MAENESTRGDLVSGALGIEALTNNLKATLAEVEAWRDTGLATDLPQRLRGPWIKS
ncbi:MAG: hypothetical protein JO110_23980 [Acetobacteraceae bacterium]|nr:hypothetical protein [Acetobacteraceae bacterium]